VRLPLVGERGTYLTGPISLASHIHLRIDKGVTLLGTTNHSKYRVAFLNDPYHANEALVSAYQAIDTGIIGGGIIDGQGGAPASDGRPSWWKLTQETGATIDGTTWYAAGTTPSIANTPPETVTTLPELPCGRSPEK